MRKVPIFATAEAVEEAFYDAMSRGDLEGMMSLWADDEDAVCVHPGGPRLVGLAAIRESWTSILGAGGVNVRIRDARAHTGAVIAVHTVIEQIVVQGRMGTQVVECVATNVYLKGAAGWRMLVHHASAADEAGEAPAPAGTVLH